MGEIADELEKQMTYAFKHVLYGESVDEDDEDYESFAEAMRIFVNPSGIGYGASQYGLFLSYPGANVLSFHLNEALGNDVTLDNVYIHDLHHQTQEYVGIRTSLRVFVNSFNAPLHIRWLLGDDIYEDILSQGSNVKWDINYEYKGNIVTDVNLGMLFLFATNIFKNTNTQTQTKIHSHGGDESR